MVVQLEVVSIDNYFTKWTYEVEAMKLIIATLFVISARVHGVARDEVKFNFYNSVFLILTIAFQNPSEFIKFCAEINVKLNIFDSL